MTHTSVANGVYSKVYDCVSKSFRTESINAYTLTFGITHWGAARKFMAAKLTRLTHKAIQLHLVVESCTICSSRFRRPVRKLLDTPATSHLWCVQCIRTRSSTCTMSCTWTQHTPVMRRQVILTCSRPNYCGVYITMCDDICKLQCQSIYLSAHPLKRLYFCHSVIANVQSHRFIAEVCGPRRCLPPKTPCMDEGVCVMRRWSENLERLSTCW
jgi:hypothetical protein